MTRKEIDKLRGQQTDQQKQLDTAREEAERLAKAEEPIPDELKERAVKARDEVVSLGEQITEAELAFSRSLEQNSEFLSTLVPAVRETTVETPGPDGPSTEVTRDTVDVFTQRMQQQYGSSLRDLPQRIAINTESERLCLDMMRCPNDQFPARAGEFAARQKRIAAKSQQRHSTGVTAGGTDQGGYMVPDDNTFMREVQLAELAHGGVMSVARVITTMNGAPLPIPTIDDTAATGAGRRTENAASTDVDLTFGEKSMGAYMITSGRLSATHQAIQDAGQNLPMLLGMLAMERIQRIESDLFMNGDGVGDPQGAEVGFAVEALAPLTLMAYDISSAKYVIHGGTVSRKPWEDFIDVKKAVNAAYRMGPRFSLVTSDLLDTYFSRAVGTDGHPIFRDWGMMNTARGGMSYGGMNIVTDYSLADPDLATAGDNRPWGLVGDFAWFWIRKVAGMAMIRDPYTNAANLATNWVFGRRCDSRALFNTGNNPAVRQIQLDTVA